MRRKVSEKTIKRMRRLHSKGSLVEDLADEAGIAFSTAYGYIYAGSPHEYWEKSAEERQKRPEYQALSKLVKTRLSKIGKDYSWLAREIDVSREMIRLYAEGKSIPKGKKLNRLFSALKVKYKTLDEVVEA